MKTGLELMNDLFANVPEPGEEIYRKRGRIAGLTVLAVANVAIPNPVEWLLLHAIPIERTLYELGAVNGVFAHNGDSSVVRLKERDDLADPKVARTIWHEIGHAIDFLGAAVGGKLTYIQGGQYSTKHREVLLEHAELIVALRMRGDVEWLSSDDWGKYARLPEELWAELVAIVCTNPRAIMASPKLWTTVRADMLERCLPIPEQQQESPHENNNPPASLD